MDTGTEVMNMDDMDAIVSAFNNDDAEALMEASGQGGNTNRQVGLPRLNINYDAETEDGQTLPRGAWKMYLDGRFVYADKVSFRPILRTFEYSVWDQESGTFSSKSVQKVTLSGMFPDTTGGNKCGRLTREEEDRLPKDDIAYLNSRAVVCNQVLYYFDAALQLGICQHHRYSGRQGDREGHRRAASRCQCHAGGHANGRGD